jgi:hypothetical protein
VVVACLKPILAFVLKEKGKMGKIMGIVNVDA